MAYRDIYIKIEDNPAFSEFNPADFSLPTEAELIKGYANRVDNFSIPEQDPTNWLTFDAGDGDANSPKWVFRNTEQYPDANDLSGTNSLVFRYSNESLPIYETHGTRFQFLSSGGPRNLGYTEITDDTWIRMNHQTGYQDSLGAPIQVNNEVWKEGSIELTLKPTKNNCTILSGTILSDIKSQFTTTDVSSEGEQYGIYNVPDGTGDTIKQEVKRLYGVNQDNVYSDTYSVYYAPNAGARPIPYIYEDIQKGLFLTDLTHTVRTFKVDLINGIIRISYEIYYGDNKKYIEFYGKTNIVDGNWHHIVINRPSPFTVKDGDNKYGADGCIEIWVDGQLDARSYEITTNDPIPTPNVLFNDYTNPGILNYPGISAFAFSSSVTEQPWMVQEIAKTNYVGGIRDFIFRQSIALSPHYIGLNYIYAIKNDEKSRICKAVEAVATAKIIQPNVSVNKKTILKLYWDTLLDDKEKCLNGLEFDESYNVYSYSVTKKNLISATQTFNLDLNDSTKTRTFLNNVKTAIGKHIFVPKPGIIVDAQSADLGYEVTGLHKDFIDYTHDMNVLKQYYGDRSARFINNLQYGGVPLLIGDRVLLFNQPRMADNGVWIFNGPDTRMTRPDEVKLIEYKNALVYVTDGHYAGKTYIQTNNITNIRTSAQKWIEVDNSISLSTSDVYPVHTTPWTTSIGETRFININTDINFNYDIIAFMNYPTENKEIIDSIKTESDLKTKQRYKEFIANIKTAINAGKDIYVSSPMLAVDLGIVSDYVSIDQMLDTTGDAQSAAISPFENGEPASNYFDTHRNIKYHVATTLAGLTNKQTYIMSDMVTYSPNGIDSDYHIKYNYRQFGLQEGDEFIIPGLTTVPETRNSKLPGYVHNQRGIAPIYAFEPNKIIFGTAITKFSNNVYNGSTAVANPYDDYITTIAATYGNGKIFVNCVENGYAFSRSDYNTGIIQNVTAGQNAETVQTAAWQYSTKRLNKKNLYDFSEISSLIGQTTPTDGGGGAIVQSQSHCSNGVIRKNTDKDNLQYQSDLYPDFTEEIFTTTKIPVLSMTWLGLKWLAE